MGVIQNDWWALPLRLVSNRNRSAALSPMPTEHLPRGEDTIDHPPAQRRPLPAWVRPDSFTHVLGDVREVLKTNRTATPAQQQAPMPSLDAAKDNVTGYCYFLDADDVGISEIRDTSWTGPPIDGHTHSIAILVAQRKSADPKEAGVRWILGGEQAAAELRATEIATVLSRYLAALGYSAMAHSTAASEIDLNLVGVQAGLLERGRKFLRHPFLGDVFGLAAVTTDLVLPVDGPLIPRTTRENLNTKARYLSGWGGTRPGWKVLNGKDRPWALGRYPMEKVKRVDEPTTLIIADEVQQASARHNFFVRAGAGDLGPRPKTEVGRFVEKAPHGLAARGLLGQLTALHEGPVAPDKASNTDDPHLNAVAVKALGHFLGADITGICKIPDYAWYSHRADGTPIDPIHTNAIAFVLDQGRDTMEGASGDDWISGAQSMRAYLRASIISNVIAAHIRRLGHEAKAHSSASDDLAHIPLLLHAGMGELSRIGELVLNPFVGPRFKSGVISTNMPLTADKPIDFGLQDFCTKCTKCARECPCGAIRFGGKKMFNGYEMWKPDVDRCARYRITNMRGSACGRCMKTCPYNTEGVLTEWPFLWAAMNLPSARAAIARLDDKLGRGAINPQKKWWLDIEVVDGVPVEPPKGANQRNLNFDRKPRDDDSYAMFPPDIAPPGDIGFVASPVDRDAGIEASRQAETPAQARVRRSDRS